MKIIAKYFEIMMVITISEFAKWEIFYLSLNLYSNDIEYIS